MDHDQSRVGARPPGSHRVARDGQECGRHPVVGKPVQRVLAHRKGLGRWRADVRPDRPGAALEDGLRARLRAGAASAGRIPLMRTLTWKSLSLLVVASALQAQTVAITGGKVYTVSGAPIDNGTVLIRNGRIAEVGANVAVPADAQRIDATGKIVTPGLINSATELGLVDISAERPTRDMSARGTNAIAAAFTVWEGFNPASVYLAPARNEGITTVVIAPTGGLVSGQAAVLDLVDGSMSDMLIKAPVGIIAHIDDQQSANANSRGELLVKLRELLEDARVYARRKSEFERAQTRDFVAGRLDLEAMIPVVEGRLPLIVAADRESDIEAALRLMREYNLKLIIAGGAEGWLVADRLAAAKVPVLTGAMTNIPQSFSALGSYQENAAMMRRAGVDVILIGDAGTGDAETFHVRNLKQEAGHAVA